MISIQSISLAVIAGIFPALLWLWFWLQEDRMHPEPRRFIVISFILGMVAVPLAIPLQHLASIWLVEGSAVLFAWAGIEELLKLIAAYIGGLHRQVMDEPIDALIYLITPALGFAAMENVLFLIDPIANGSIALSFITTNVRFFGTTLVHVVASSIIGTAIAFSFFRRQRVQEVYVVVGAMLAITLHTLFNFHIMEASTGKIFIVFLVVWTAAFSLILVFQKIKSIKLERIKDPKP